MTNEDRVIEWLSKYIDPDIDDSSYENMIDSLLELLKNQREMCATEVEREGYRKNHVPTIQDYVKACINAIGE